MFFKKRAHTGERLDRVAKLYLAYKFFGTLYFAYPLFYEFATQAITPIQVGIFFSITSISAFMAEIPTGVIADKHGRKLSALIGTGLLCFAPLIIFFGHAWPTYIVAALFYGIGRAFLSGALESLVYDHKNVSKEVYRRVNTLEITFGQAGILASAALGGVMFLAHPSIPFVAETLAGLVCLALIAGMQELHKDDHVPSKASHRQHFTQSMRHLFASPFLKVLVPMGVLFSVMLGMSIQFVNEAAMIEQGLSADTRGLLIASAGIVTLIILNFFLLRRVTSDTVRIIYLVGGAVVAYGCMASGVMPLFLAGYIIWSCLNATSSFIRVMIHDRIPSSHRSTILSNFKALAVLVGIGASTATGVLVQWAHTPRAGYIVFTLISLLLLLPCAGWLIAHLQKQQI